ncbi:hypothetical protein B5E77_15690 [Lachnoclostridium sp. An131]|nr:hypothetical protein B5E77_15690 [Lachnoclostridium sp. An131]
MNQKKFNPGHIKSEPPVICLPADRSHISSQIQKSFHTKNSVRYTTELCRLYTDAVFPIRTCPDKY